MSKKYLCDVCGKPYEIIKSAYVCDVYLMKYATDSLFSGLRQENSDICMECKNRLCDILHKEIAAIQQEHNFHPEPTN